MQARNYSTLKDASSLYELILPPPVYSLLTWPSKMKAAKYPLIILRKFTMLLYHDQHTHTHTHTHVQASMWVCILGGSCT